MTPAILGLGLTCNPCPGNPELQDPRTPAGACNPWLLVIALGPVCPLATVLCDPPLHCICCPLYTLQHILAHCSHCSIALPTAHTAAHPCRLYTLQHNLAYCKHCSIALPTVHTAAQSCPLYTLLHSLTHCTHCSPTLPPWWDLRYSLALVLGQKLANPTACSASFHQLFSQLNTSSNHYALISPS